MFALLENKGADKIVQKNSDVKRKKSLFITKHLNVRKYKPKNNFSNNVIHF